MTVLHSLHTEGLVSGYGRTRIVDDVDIEIPAGRISVIVGANACGKSTLLKTISRLIPSQAGSVVLDGKRIDQIPTKDLARTLGLLPAAGRPRGHRRRRSGGTRTPPAPAHVPQLDGSG